MKKQCARRRPTCFIICSSCCKPAGLRSRPSSANWRAEPGGAATRRRRRARPEHNADSKRVSMNLEVSRAPLESPFRRFTRDEWAQLRADTQLTLTIDDLRKLQSTHDPISLDEVVAIY